MVKIWDLARTETDAVFFFQEKGTRKHKEGMIDRWSSKELHYKGDMQRQYNTKHVSSNLFAIGLYMIGNVRIVESYWYWTRTHDIPAMIRYVDHWATAAPKTVAEAKRL
ncbi:hypothetical protein TNCV_1361441 [Trichonephila clavipes]|nr:hypothetical protein TNCV_1361441 [Trichonephila clavipes]